jgi:hypothetical protein
MLKQPSGPRRVQTLNNTFTALVQACLRHQKTIRKHAKEPRVTRHPESDAGCFRVGRGLRVEATAYNVDNDGKRPGPEYAGKALSHHACCWVHPGKNASDLGHKDGQWFGRIPMLCREHPGNRRRTRSVATNAVDGICREHHDCSRRNTRDHGPNISI